VQLYDTILERLKWDTYKGLLQNIQSGLKALPESYLFPKGEPGQMPEVFRLYRRCNALGTLLWWAGGVADQPHILIREFEMCAAAESRFQNEELPKLREMDAKLRKADGGT
jgi:hypothetical protein